MKSSAYRVIRQPPPWPRSSTYRSRWPAAEPGPLLAAFPCSVGCQPFHLHHALLQKVRHQAQHLPVADLPLKCLRQKILLEYLEVALRVRIHHPGVPLPQAVADPLDGLSGSPSGPKSVADPPQSPSRRSVRSHLATSPAPPGRAPAVSPTAASPGCPRLLDPDPLHRRGLVGACPHSAREQLHLGAKLLLPCSQLQWSTAAAPSFRITCQATRRDAGGRRPCPSDYTMSPAFTPWTRASSIPIGPDAVALQLIRARWASRAPRPAPLAGACAARRPASHLHLPAPLRSTVITVASLL